MVSEIRDQIVDAIVRERAYQDSKWGALKEHPHQVGEWLLIMQRELSEAIDAWTDERGDLGALQEILQVIAVGFACLEQHGVFERDEISLKADCICGHSRFGHRWPYQECLQPDCDCEKFAPSFVSGAGAPVAGRVGQFGAGGELMRAFTPNGIVTSEVCPVCREPDVEVEHGFEADIDLEGNVKIDTALYRHLWHCPECGDELAWVVNCQICEGYTTRHNPSSLLTSVMVNQEAVG